MDRGMDSQQLSPMTGMAAITRQWLMAALLCLLPIASVAQNYSYGQLRDSLEQATSLLKKFPDNVDLRLKKASWNIFLEQWDYAQREYDHILERDPDNVAALYFRAYTHERQHHYKLARKDYEDMLRIVPGDFNGQLGLALLCQKDMHYSEAMTIINHLVEQYPSSAVAYAARGGMEAERQMFDLAEYDFTEAIRLDPTNNDYLINRADIRIRKGDKKHAREDLDEAVRRGIAKPSLAELYGRCR